MLLMPPVTVPPPVPAYHAEAPPRPQLIRVAGGQLCVPPGQALTRDMLDASQSDADRASATHIKRRLAQLPSGAEVVAGAERTGTAVYIDRFAMLKAAGVAAAYVPSVNAVLLDPQTPPDDAVHYLGHEFDHARRRGPATDPRLAAFPTEDRVVVGMPRERFAAEMVREESQVHARQVALLVELAERGRSAPLAGLVRNGADGSRPLWAEAVDTYKAEMARSRDPERAREVTADRIAADPHFTAAYSEFARVQWEGAQTRCAAIGAQSMNDAPVGVTSVSFTPQTSYAQPSGGRSPIGGGPVPESYTPVPHQPSRSYTELPGMGLPEVARLPVAAASADERRRLAAELSVSSDAVLTQRALVTQATRRELMSGNARPIDQIAALDGGLDILRQVARGRGLDVPVLPPASRDNVQRTGPGLRTGGLEL